MIDVIAIARCHRCNVISLPLHPNRSDPTHASISLPHDWAGLRVFLDGEEDFILCPDCRAEAWDWLTTRVARKSSSEGKCLNVFYNHSGGGSKDFCDLEKGHTGPHASRIYLEGQS
jgi:RNA polymerase subunit RPABC4/transcription elongation factor Spt4